VVSFKLVVADPETGRCTQLEVKEPAARALLGLKIGDELSGELVGLKGRLRITGGSDASGAPMRPDVQGPGRRYVLLSGPPGFRPTREGERRRKLVHGNTISEDIVQINAVLVKKEGRRREARAAQAA